MLPNRRISLIPILFLAMMTLLGATVCAAQNFVQDTVSAFENSDFVFQRGGSNIPFIPIAYLGARTYGEAQIENTLTGQTLNFEQQGASAATGVPFLLGKRDAVVFGAYLGSNRFERFDRSP